MFEFRNSLNSDVSPDKTQKVLHECLVSQLNGTEPVKLVNKLPFIRQLTHFTARKSVH